MTLATIPLTELAAALELGRHEHVAVVGGGGKTTTLHALADRLVGSTIITTTTKMGHDQHRGRPVLLSPTDEQVAAIEPGTPVMVWRATEGTKAVGVAPGDCDRWFAIIDHVLVEADGARRRPFKAPGPLEPVVPATTTMLVSMIGADALGRVIGDRCHRPLRVAALAGCRPYERLTPERAAAVLVHDRGFRASRPPSARMAIVITKVDDEVAGVVEALVDELSEVAVPGLVVIPVEAGSARVTDRCLDRP